MHPANATSKFDGADISLRFIVASFLLPANANGRWLGADISECVHRCQGSMTQPPLQGLQYAGAFAALHVVLSLAFKGVYGEKRSHLTAMGGTGAVKDPAKVRDMVAFNLITAGFQFYCAWFGTVGWYDGTADAIGGSTKERLYSHSQIAETMCVVALGFEIYNTCMVLFFTEYRNAPFIGHHTVTGVGMPLQTTPIASRDRPETVQRPSRDRGAQPSKPSIT